MTIVGRLSILLCLIAALGPAGLASAQPEGPPPTSEIDPPEEKTPEDDEEDLAVQPKQPPSLGSGKLVPRTKAGQGGGEAAAKSPPEIEKKEVVVEPVAPVVQSPAAEAVAEKEEEEAKPTLLERVFSEWKGEVSAGLFGTEGNRDLVRLSGGINIKKKWTGNEVNLRSDYVFARENRGESENRFRFTGRHDRRANADSRWGVFSQADVEINRFRNFDLRLTLRTGPTLKVVDTKDFKINADVGLAGTREFGAVNGGWRPEGSGKLRLNYKINARNNITASADYLPNIEKFSRFRLNSVAAWDTVIDPDLNLTLRMQVEHRYNSNAAPRVDESDIRYSLRLVWKF